MQSIDLNDKNLTINQTDNNNRIPWSLIKRVLRKCSADPDKKYYVEAYTDYTKQKTSYHYLNEVEEGNKLIECTDQSIIYYNKSPSSWNTINSRYPKEYKKKLMIKRNYMKRNYKKISIAKVVKEFSF
jgi:hypothetical protein